LRLVRVWERFLLQNSLFEVHELRSRLVRFRPLHRVLPISLRESRFSLDIIGFNQS
jgi:hypothetical protein